MSKNEEHRQVTLGDFLTDEEIEKAMMLTDKDSIKESVIEPNIERINKALGQENDSDYLAYMVLYVVEVNRNR